MSAGGQPRKEMGPPVEVTGTHRSDRRDGQGVARAARRILGAYPAGPALPRRTLWTPLWTPQRASTDLSRSSHSWARGPEDRRRMRRIGRPERPRPSRGQAESGDARRCLGERHGAAPPRRVPPGPSPQRQRTLGASHPDPDRRGVAPTRRGMPGPTGTREPGRRIALPRSRAEPFVPRDSARSVMPPRTELASPRLRARFTCLWKASLAQRHPRPARPDLSRRPRPMPIRAPLRPLPPRPRADASRERGR